MATTLILARHGETEWNASGRWQGHADPPLNERGRAQAAALADALKAADVEAIVASDLRRALETAELVGRGLGLAVTSDRGLREIDVGSWSGLTRTQVSERFPDGFARWQAGEIGHDGETREELTERIVAALLRIGRVHEGKRVLVVTHGGAIRAALRHATGDPGEPVHNCATVALRIVDDGLVAHP